MRRLTGYLLATLIVGTKRAYQPTSEVLYQGTGFGIGSGEGSGTLATESKHA